MSRATEVGDAVVTSINDAVFSMEFTAARKYRPINTLKDLADLTVTILVPNVVQSEVTRRDSEDTITVDVLIQKQVDPSDNDETDALLDLAEEIGDHFRGLGIGNGAWLGTEIVTIYDMEDLSEWRLFSALIRLSYKRFWSGG